MPLGGPTAGLWFAAIIVIEARTADSLVRPRVFRNRGLPMGTTIAFIFMAAFGASASAQVYRDLMSR